MGQRFSTLVGGLALSGVMATEHQLKPVDGRPSETVASYRAPRQLAAANMAAARADSCANPDMAIGGADVSTGRRRLFNIDEQTLQDGKKGCLKQHLTSWTRVGLFNPVSCKSNGVFDVKVAGACIESGVELTRYWDGKPLWTITLKPFNSSNSRQEVKDIFAASSYEGDGKSNYTYQIEIDSRTGQTLLKFDTFSGLILLSMPPKGMGLPFTKWLLERPGDCELKLKPLEKTV